MKKNSTRNYSYKDKDVEEFAEKIANQNMKRLNISHDDSMYESYDRLFKATRRAKGNKRSFLNAVLDYFNEHFE